VPFTGRLAVAIAMKHVQEAPVPPRQIVPAIPAELEQSCCARWRRIRPRRYHSADEMGMDLDRVRKGLGSRRPPPRSRRPTRTRVAHDGRGTAAAAYRLRIRWRRRPAPDSAAPGRGWWC
jgi:hypothetical protein